jgi:hypothetical protein
MRVAVLTYHSQNVAGNDYHSNDHVAFVADLEQVLARGMPIVSLHQVACALRGQCALPPRAVAFSCDDGADFDYRDLSWPEIGKQKSFATAMREHAQKHAAVRLPPMTAFVIADSLARQELDRRCLKGLGWMSDDWWAAAVDEGLFHIANHGWDHLHSALERYAGDRENAGQSQILDYQTADRQIRQAMAAIERRARNPGLSLFAYPFGEWTSYLAAEYFPTYGVEHGVDAAFTTQPEIIHPGTNRWLTPRYVCGAHWTSPEGLGAILRGLG